MGPLGLSTIDTFVQATPPGLFTLGLCYICTCTPQLITHDPQPSGGSRCCLLGTPHGSTLAHPSDSMSFAEGLTYKSPAAHFNGYALGFPLFALFCSTWSSYLAYFLSWASSIRSFQGTVSFIIDMCLVDSDRSTMSDLKVV